MAEFHFYGSGDDSRAFLNAIIEPADIRVTPSLNYDTRHPKSYTAVDEALLEAIGMNPRLYITGQFSKHPLHLHQVPSGRYGGTYVVDLRRGGPGLSISLPMCKVLDGRLYHLGPGNLFCHNVFLGDKDREYKAPPEAKAAYVELRKRVKSVLKRRSVGGDNVWIGEGGYELLESGKALILISGNWVDAAGNIVKSNLDRTD